MNLQESEAWVVSVPFEFKVFISFQFKSDNMLPMES